MSEYLHLNKEDKKDYPTIKHSSRADYQTNGLSYYDYLGEINDNMDIMEDFINDLVDKYKDRYYLNIVTLGAKGDNNTDNSCLFGSFKSDQMYYVPKGTYVTSILPKGLFFGWGVINYNGELIPLSITVPQKVRVNMNKTQDERYQNFILGQNSALKANENTYALTSLGYSVLKENVEGRRLTGIGKGALSNIVNGYSNVGIGADSIGQGTYGQRNTAIGDNSLKWGGTTDAIKTLHDFWLKKGNENFVNSYFVPKYPDIWKYLGTEDTPDPSLYPKNDTEYKYNVGIGRNALLHGMKSLNNVAVGYNSQAHTMIGNGNTSIGDRSLRDNVVGHRNTANGMYALTNNITGSDNVSLGGNTLQQTLHATNNTAVGYGSMHFFKDDKNLNSPKTATFGVRNTALGTQTMQDGKNASYSTFVGSYAGRYVEGNFNVGVGSASSELLTTGERNTAIGSNSNRAIITGSQNVSVGYSAGAGGDYSNTVSLGYNSHAQGNDLIQIGTSSQLPITNNQLLTLSDNRINTDIVDTTLGLDFIKSIKPVDFKNGDYNQHGVIAQDILEYNNTHDDKFKGIFNSNEKGGSSNYYISYTEFIAPLIKSIQDLSSQVETLTTENTAIKADIETLKTDNETFKTDIAQMKQDIEELKGGTTK
ncbi:tail fiber domain-containing protein [Lactococcus petauri]|uniref:tail fiber domain-containing protein n=1 Tax=Lactococcus petauri TaxID=1940789 RepID=UPI0021526925|nr:tail fiber domain-containing protein [Lactococcus petauri]MCR6590476.1 tail fiber domain-containing protein [Lactococcus petauri]